MESSCEFWEVSYPAICDQGPQTGEVSTGDSHSSLGIEKRRYTLRWLQYSGSLPMSL